MLKHNEVNPLTVFGLRRMGHCPPHFSTMTFDVKVNEKVISDWIWEHLTGRFFIGDAYIQQDGNTHIQIEKQVGFEIQGELSYFSLMLDTINS